MRMTFRLRKLWSMYPKICTKTVRIWNQFELRFTNGLPRTLRQFPNTLSESSVMKKMKRMRSNVSKKSAAWVPNCGKNSDLKILDMKSNRIAVALIPRKLWVD